MGEAPADLESTLDRLIARLAKPGAAKEAKALLVDVRRLREAQEAPYPLEELLAIHGRARTMTARSRGVHV